MIDLTCCTLVSAIYNNSQHHLDLTIRMLRYMQSVAKFGKVILFSAIDDTSLSQSYWVASISPMDSEAFQSFTIQKIPGYISTPFMMTCHYDGMIIEPSLWSEEFLRYDYIGAPWGDKVVGNEGFSIQSQRALWAKSKLSDFATPQADEFVCRMHRKHMRQHGVRFAPWDVALRFATETWGNENPSLGYHGKVEAAAKHKLAWELIEDFEKGVS